MRWHPMVSCQMVNARMSYSATERHLENSLPPEDIASGSSRMGLPMLGVQWCMFHLEDVPDQRSLLKGVNVNLLTLEMTSGFTFIHKSIRTWYDCHVIFTNCGISWFKL
jgi:hypothetical protein